MRTSILLLAAAIALVLVLPRCSARPDYIKSEKSQKASASTAVSAASKEEEIKKSSCGGDYSKKSKQQSSSAAAASSSSSHESYEAKSVGGKSSCKKELTEADIKKEYAQKKGESLEVYFKRILTKTSYTSTTESYIKTLNIVRKDFSSLDLWYDRKYITILKDYYSVLYKKISTESEEEYYSRLIKKDSWETEEQYARRITIVRDLFFSLPLWTEDKFFEKYTKSLYAIEFKKFKKESDEEYLKRIFTKDSFFDKSDEIWAKRIHLIQEATCSNAIWYEEKYFSYFKSFYEFYYKKAEKESAEAWLTRVLKPLPGEKLEYTIKRVTFIKKVSESWGFWKAEYFKKIQEAKTFQAEYLSKLEKTFFSSCGCATYEKKSSSKKSAASSSSASASEESTVIKS